MTERAAPFAPTPCPRTEVLPWMSVIRVGLAAGFGSHLPWLVCSRFAPLRAVSTLMPFVFLAFDPWLTVPLVVRVRRNLADRASEPAMRSSAVRAGIVCRAACAGLFSGAIAATSIVVWERIRLGEWLPMGDVLAHLIYPSLAALYAAIAVGAAILVPSARAARAARAARDAEEHG